MKKLIMFMFMMILGMFIISAPIFASPPNAVEKSKQVTIVKAVTNIILVDQLATDGSSPQMKEAPTIMLKETGMQFVNTAVIKNAVMNATTTTANYAIAATTQNKGSGGGDQNQEDIAANNTNGNDESLAKEMNVMPTVVQRE